jgi:hypothetical protein
VCSCEWVSWTVCSCDVSKNLLDVGVAMSCSPMCDVLQSHVRCPAVPCAFSCSPMCVFLQSHVRFPAVPRAMSCSPVCVFLQSHVRYPAVPCAMSCSPVCDVLQSCVCFPAVSCAMSSQVPVVVWDLSVSWMGTGRKISSKDNFHFRCYLRNRKSHISTSPSSSHPSALNLTLATELHCWSYCL